MKHNSGRLGTLVIALLLAAAFAVGGLAVALRPPAAGRSTAAARLSLVATAVAHPVRDLPRTRARVRPVTHRPRAHPVARPAARPVTHRVRHQRRPTPKKAPFTLAVATRRGEAALASLHAKPVAGWKVHFEIYHGRYLGMADSGTKTVTLWVKATDSRQQLRITLAHELGHVLDYTTVGGSQRSQYLSLRGQSASTTRWYPCNGCEDYAYPVGDFAEVYALWLAGPGDFRSRFAATPTSAQLTRLGAFFTSLNSA